MGVVRIEEYASDWGIYPSANQWGQQSKCTDRSDLASGSTLWSWEMPHSCEPEKLRMGFFPQRKISRVLLEEQEFSPGCCTSRNNGSPQIPTATFLWILIVLVTGGGGLKPGDVSISPLWAACKPWADFIYSISTPLSSFLQSWYSSLSPRGQNKWPSLSHNQWHSVRCDRRGHLALVPLSFLPVQGRGALEAEGRSSEKCHCLSEPRPRLGSVA